MPAPTARNMKAGPAPKAEYEKLGASAKGAEYEKLDASAKGAGYESQALAPKARNMKVRLQRQRRGI